jgi:DNA-binding transcriptional MerR regulator
MKRIKQDVYLSQKDIIDLLGISGDRLQYWIRTSLIRPSILQKGRGRSHLFNLEAVFYIALAYQFDRLGFDLEMINRLMKEAKSQFDALAQDFSKGNNFEKGILSITRDMKGPHASLHVTVEDALLAFDPLRVFGKDDLLASSIIILVLPKFYSQLLLRISKSFYEQTLKEYSKLKKLESKTLLPFENFLLGLMIESRYTGNREKIDKLRETLLKGVLPAPYTRFDITPEEALKLFDDLDKGN